MYSTHIFKNWFRKQSRRAALVFARNYFMQRLIARTERDFGSLKDFQVSWVGSKYCISFDPRYGYAPTWEYEPCFSFDVFRNAWRIEIGREIFYVDHFPMFELINELRGYTLLDILTPESVCIDAGASTGLSGIYFAKRAFSGKVYFLEPDNRAFTMLKKNLAMNDLENYEAISSGLSHFSGMAELRMSEVGASKLVEGEMGGVSIPVTTLAKLVDDHEIRRLDILKMDIEGVEVHLGANLVDLLARFPECVCLIASYHPVSGERSSAILERFFLDYPSLVCKTIYPLHETTVLIHRDNQSVLQKLERLPNYQEGLSIAEAVRA